MTYLEKFKQDKPGSNPERCPCYYHLCDDEGCVYVYSRYAEGCADCWNREMPDKKNNDYARAEILDTAKRIVTGDREQQYGSPEDNFTTIAGFWTTYLRHDITADDVAMMMVLLKVARIQSGQVKADNYVDLAGYAACAAEIAGGKHNA